ncbi:MAG: alpha-2-macroglobulin family protein [Desulfovibrionaceae bacterium]|nr:alpha-2-macroglobulin family protein [Desulfovibrionaceae bacterium]
MLAPRVIFSSSCKFLFALLPVLGVLLCVQVDAEAGPAYRKLEISSPEFNAWDDSLMIWINVDREQCEKKYGENWPQQCSAASPGVAGQPVEGIRMTPDAPGVWRWSDSSSMWFDAAEPLKPETTYAVSLENVPLPERFSLPSRTVKYTTMPQAVHIGAETFWVDPSRKGEHALSVPLTFIWPVNSGDMERKISIVPSDPKSGLSFGTPRFVWNESGDELTLNVPVAGLPARNASARLEIEGIPRYSYDNNGRRVVAPLKKDKTASAAEFAVKGSTALMDVTDIRILPGYGPNLEREYHLEVHTSLQTRPEEVLRHLDLKLLPRKNVDSAGRDCDWTAMPAIGAEDIARAQTIDGILLQPAQEAATITRMRIPAEAGRGLMAAMRTGLPSTSGLTLSQVRRFILNVPSFSAELHILQPGNILSLTGSQTLDFHSVGLSSIHWRAERVREPFLALLASERGFTGYETDLDAMSSVKEGKIDIAPGKPGEPAFSSLDLAPLYRKQPGEDAGQGERYGLMHLVLTGYAGDRLEVEESRLILLTDLGMLVKDASDGSRTVFVRHLGSGEPAKNVEVRLLGANGLPVQTAVTDSSGRADLPSTLGLERERRPAAVVAVSRRGGQSDMSWLSLSEYSREVSYDEFDIGGRITAPNGLIASVFSQRGIYLPGETMHFGCLVRRSDWKDLPPDLSLEAILYSPVGKVLEKRIETGSDGMASLSWQSPEDAPTGVYNLDIRLSNENSGSNDVLGSAVVRLEEFQPDTMALRAAFEPVAPKGWIVTSPGSKASGMARFDNLYGEAAAGHRLQARMRIMPGMLQFPGYEDFTFPQLSTAAQGGEFELYEGYTDEKGEVRFDLPLGKLPTGVCKGVILLEGFESEGGRAVTKSLSSLFASQKTALGYKPEKGANNLDYVVQNTPAALRLIILDNDLKPVELSGASAILSARRYVNSLVSDARGNYYYDATPVDTEMSRQELNIPAAGLSMPLPTENAGDFLLSVRDAQGALLASIPYSVAGMNLTEPENLSLHNMSKGDLRIKLEKTEYASGDTLRFRMSAPFAGSGLITVERDRVEAHAWFRAAPGESVQEIELPEDFEGRGYLNVSFVRDGASDAIYMNPHAFGVAPFTVGLERHEMGLELKAPEAVLPGQELKFEVSSQLPGRVQVFAVDEGVLQLTGFSTPSPLHDLLLDRALGVGTRQAFDLLMPDHSRLRGRIPAFGGGMDGSGGRFLNPFKRKSEPPFSFWSELIEVDDDGRELSVVVPAWCSGKIRIMAVGSAFPEDESMAAGSAEAFTLVRGTLLLKPQLPLAVAPGDEFEGALVVANTVEGSGENAEIAVQMQLPQELELIDGDLEQTLSISENSEKSLRFRLKAGESLGDAGIRFTAGMNDGEHMVERSQSLSIRPLSPRLRTERTGIISGGGQSVASLRSLYPFEAITQLSAAPAPVLALRSLVQRLDAYPYGCTEQCISRAMPYVILWNAPKLQSQVMRPSGGDSRTISEKRDEAIARAVSAIQASFFPYRGVSAWPGGMNDLFVTAYAADFLVSMRENGMAVPEGLSASLLDCLEMQIRRTPENVNDGRIKAYGAWVLLRDGRIMTSTLEMIENWFKDNTNNWENDVLTALLADGYHMLRLKSRGTKRLPGGNLQGTNDPRFSGAVSYALYATVLHRNFGEHVDRISMQNLLDAALNEHASTLELAMSARALAYLAAGGLHDPSSVNLSCSEYAPGFEAENEAEQAMHGSFLQLDAPGCRDFNIRLSGDVPPNLYWSLTEDGFDRALPSPASQGMEVRRCYLDAAGEPVSELKLGQVVTVEISARAFGGNLNDVVLLDLLPGGLEPVLEQNTASERVPGLIRQERREDRVIFFVNLSTAEAYFSYKARAVTRGSFGLPPAMGEAMYAPEIHAVSEGGTITVQ